MAKLYGIGEFENKIISLFSTIEYMKHPHSELIKRYNEGINVELNSLTPSGKRRYSSYMKGFVFGQYLIQSRLLINKMEFIYILDDVMYSTCKTTKHRSTRELYNVGRGIELCKMKGHFYYPDSDKFYF